MGMGSEWARDPMFEQFTWQVGPPRVCALTSRTVREWLQVGKKVAHVHTARSHGCAVRPDCSRLLTSHWVLILKPCKVEWYNFTLNCKY
jgi:hypothetical protein